MNDREFKSAIERWNDRLFNEAYPPEVEEEEYEMSNDKLAVIVKESGIEQTKAQYVLSQFQAFAEQAAFWEEKTRALVITDASQKEEMKIARNARLNLKDIRVAAEKTKKKLKAGIIVEGRLIDAMYNFIEGVTKPIEAELKEKEEFVERQEAARIAALKAEREEQLAPYGVDPQFYNLGEMSSEAFSNLLDMTKTASAAKAAAAIKAEEERIAAERKAAEEKAAREKAEAEERSRVEAENARLAAELAKADAARKAIEEQARKDAELRAEAERKRQAEENAERERLAAIARAEREKAESEIRRANAEAEKARRELEKRREAEERARKAEADRIENERRRMEAAGDKEKLIEYLEKLSSVEQPKVTNSEANRQLTIVRICLEKSLEFARKI